MLLALPGLLFCFSSFAVTSSSTDKPDPYARKHYTMASISPRAQQRMKKKTEISDAEIAAEIAREDAGTEAAAPAPLPTVRSRMPAGQRVFVCTFAVGKKPHEESSIASRYLISDSDGFDACGEHGGDIMAGNDDDRDLMNVKDSAIMKRPKPKRQ